MWDARRLEEAEDFVVTWGKGFCGKKYEDCPNWYLKFIAENFNGLPGSLADYLLQWRIENGEDVD